MSVKQRIVREIRRKDAAGETHVRAEIATLGGWRFIEPYRMNVSKMRCVCNEKIQEPEGEVLIRTFLDTKGEDLPTNVGCKSDLGLEGETQEEEPQGFWAKIFK